jgi:AcrR family transcriptional regulator
MPASKREQLVETAAALFYENGFTATGIDRVLKEAGVAKMTLYNHFKSKDELIIAALHRRDEKFRHWLTTTLDKRASTPREKLVAFFDVYGEWFAQKDFRGCMFINASAEFAQHSRSIQSAAAEHKRLVVNYLLDLANEAGLSNPEELAAQLAMIADGAVVQAQVLAREDAAAVARDMATFLIAKASA